MAEGDNATTTDTTKSGNAAENHRVNIHSSTDNQDKGKTNAGDDNNGAGNKPTSAAELRAELAAERVARRTEGERLTGEVTELKTKLEKLASEAENKTQAEVNKIKAQTDKLAAKIIDATIKAAAAAAGLSDPDLLGHSFFDRSSIKVDDDGNVTGVDEMFNSVKEKKPEWFKAGNTNTNDNNKPAPKTGAPSPTGNTSAAPTNVKDMKPEEYAAYKNSFLRKLRTAG